MKHEYHSFVWVQFKGYTSIGHVGVPGLSKNKIQIGRIIALPYGQPKGGGLPGTGGPYYGIYLAGDRTNYEYNMEEKYLSPATLEDWDAAELMEL